MAWVLLRSALCSARSGGRRGRGGRAESGLADEKKKRRRKMEEKVMQRRKEKRKRRTQMQRKKKLMMMYWAPAPAALPGHAKRGKKKKTKTRMMMRMLRRKLRQRATKEAQALLPMRRKDWRGAVARRAKRATRLAAAERWAKSSRRGP